jgi:hypothetical protein
MIKPCYYVIVYRSMSGKVLSIVQTVANNINQIVFDQLTDSVYEYPNKGKADRNYQELKKIYHV